MLRKLLGHSWFGLGIVVSSLDSECFPGCSELSAASFLAQHLLICKLPTIECLPKEDGSFTNRVLWQFLNSAWLSRAAVFWRLAPGSENNASQLTYHPFPANHCHLTPTTHVSFDTKQNISLFERIPLPTPLSCMLHVTLHTYIEFRNSPGCLYFQDTVPVDMLVNRLLVRVIWLDKTAIALASQIFC